MSGIRNACRMLGMVVLAFGAGILLTFFLSCRTLVVLEALVIIAAGILYLIQK